MFDLVAADLASVIPVPPNGNSEVIKVLAEHGLVVGLLCPEIEQLVKTAILLQAPVASDLHFLLCVLRVLPELERSHHLVGQLAAKASHIHAEDLSPRSRELVGRMGSLAAGMFRRADDSWYLRDHSVAAVLAEHDTEMDELHASLIAEVSSGRMPLPATIEMTLMYEHLSDHAVNIADQVIYVAGFGPSVVQR